MDADAGSLACTQLSRGPSTADVVAVFRRAAYIRLHDGPIVALTDREVARGPLHVRMDRLPPMRRGEGVQILPDPAIRFGAEFIRIRQPGWSGARLTGPQLRRARSHLSLVRTVGFPPLGGRVTAREVEMAVHSRDLWGLADLIGGLGPGLTPAGDDVLAGVLLVAVLTGSDQDRGCIAAVARATRTNDISAAFLAAAAQGQSIEPAHDLLRALAVGDGVAVTAAHEQLAGFGASSGQALAYGMVLALSSLPDVMSTGS